MKQSVNSGIVAGEPSTLDRLKLRKLAGQLKQPTEPMTLRTGTVTGRNSDGSLTVDLGYTDELGAATVVTVNALKGIYSGGEPVMMIKNGSDWFVIGSFTQPNLRSIWTPVLTASTTNPTNYTSAGRYYLHGNLCTAVGQVTFNGAGVGSGTYSCSLPFAKATGQRYLGVAHYEDASTGATYNLTAINTDASSLIDRFRYVNVLGGVNGSRNWTSVTNEPVAGGPASGDFIDFEITYEVLIS